MCVEQNLSRAESGGSPLWMRRSRCTLPDSFFLISRMSLARRPQSVMSPRMSFSMMCCARPRTIMVLLWNSGPMPRSSSSLGGKRRLEFAAYSQAEVVRSLKFGNVWVFVQLISGPPWSTNQLCKKQTLPNLRLLTTPSEKEEEDVLYLQHRCPMM